MKELNISNTMWVFIIPFSVNVFNLIITLSFIEGTIPKELYEANLML